VRFTPLRGFGAFTWENIFQPYKILGLFRKKNQPFGVERGSWSQGPREKGAESEIGIIGGEISGPIYRGEIGSPFGDFRESF